MNVFANKRVLIADDSSTMRQILFNALTRMGFQGSNIRSVVDGRMALDIIGKTEFDLIISDWEMPHVDGFELLKKVKGGAAPSSLFLMVTTHDDQASQDKAFESGADQYICKPFKLDVFEKIIHHLLIKTKEFAETRVLVVDDSTPMRHIIVKNLLHAGFHEDRIGQAANGLEGFEKLKREKVDLVITDWNMPVMNGLELVKKVRSDAGLRDTPVLMVSSEAEREKIVQAIHEGANQYIIKPFNSVDLQDKVWKLLGG